MDIPILKSMATGEGKISKSKVEAFDLYDRIRSTVGEYCDDWLLVGKRAGSNNKVVIGTTDKGWGVLKPVYDNVQEWQKKNNLGNT